MAKLIRPDKHSSNNYDVIAEGRAGISTIVPGQVSITIGDPVEGREWILILDNEELRELKP